MADRDARRRRSLALLARFAIFTALLASLIIPGVAQEDLSKCRSIASSALRLECYDNLLKPTYTRMSISDFNRDRESLANVQAKVEVAGRLNEVIGPDIYELGGNLSMDKITIYTKDLPAEQRKAILDSCNTGCNVVVQGRVIGRMELSAEFIHLVTKSAK